MSITIDGAAGADHSRARIETLIARYPHIAHEEVAAIKHWIAKEASALDMGLLASNEDVAPQYRRFRAEQLDRFGFRDMALIAAVAVLLIAGLVAATVL